MYQVSRSLYRHLTPYLAPAATDSQRRTLLEECEQAVTRIFEDPDFARPARYLFDRVRRHFPIDEQACARRLVDVHVAIAQELRERTPIERDQCAAFSRSGAPCQREPRSGRVYCPSHRHLEEPAVPGAPA